MLVGCHELLELNAFDTIVEGEFFLCNSVGFWCRYLSLASSRLDGRNSEYFKAVAVYFLSCAS